MADVIKPAQLATYLGVALDEKIAYLTELANGLVNDEWKTPTTPAPTWVVTIALEAAGRPARNPKGLASVTRSVDDGSRTERLSDVAAQSGVFLTDDELRRLQQRPLSPAGRVAKTIRAKTTWSR